MRDCASEARQMGGSDPRWLTRWSRNARPRLIPDFFVRGYGTDAEPDSSYWMAAMLDPLGARFREGMRILDYGCGGGRFFNFITGHLSDFHYYGAEPAGGAELAVARSFFGSDPRATFLTCESVAEMLPTCDAAILGSVFTHLRAERCEAILDTLWPIVERGGMIVFSAMFKDKSFYNIPGAHGFAECYREAYQDWGWIGRLEARLGREITRADKFDCNNIETHYIFAIQ